jgi:hypothetical protein
MPSATDSQHMLTNKHEKRKAIVLGVDRIGGNLNHVSEKTPELPSGMPLPRFSLLVRFVGDDDRTDQKEVTMVVPPKNDIHIFAIPERGEIVWCEKDRADMDADWYYTGKVNSFISRKHKYEEVRSPIDQPYEDQEGIRPDEAIHGGKPVKWMDTKFEYDKNPNPEYDHPLVRFKPGDVVVQGRNNTLIHHSFNGHRPLEKRKGYIELVTERKFIYDDPMDHKKRFIEKSDRQYDRWEHQNSEGTRVLIGTDVNVDRRLISWYTEKEWVTKKKIDDGGPNVGRRFDIHYRDEGPSRLSTNLPEGPYPVVPNRTEKYREHIADWKEPANEKDGEYYNDPLGIEIEDLSKKKWGIWDAEIKEKNVSNSMERELGKERGVYSLRRDTGGFDEKTLLFDAIRGGTIKRLKDMTKQSFEHYKHIKETIHSRDEEFVPFDSQLPHFYVEADRISLVSRSGKDVSHAVLGEELSRFMIRLMMDIDYLARTVDLLTTRVNTFALDFAQHTHSSCPNGPSVPPSGGFRGVGGGGTGSDQLSNPEHAIWATILNVIPTTAPEIVEGNDSGSQFDESEGGDAGPKNMARPHLSVRLRLNEFRSRLNERMKELPEFLSTRVSLN